MFVDFWYTKQLRSDNYKKKLFRLCVYMEHFINDYTVYLINKIKQLTDIIGYCWCIWISTFKVFFVYFADTFHAFIYTFIIAIGAGFRARTWLNQKNCMRHDEIQCVGSGNMIIDTVLMPKLFKNETKFIQIF